MNKKSYLIRFTENQFAWLKDFSSKTGESISTLIRIAVNEYRNRIENE